MGCNVRTPRKSKDRGIKYLELEVSKNYFDKLF